MWPRQESNADEAWLVCMPTVASAPGSDMQNKKVPCLETFSFYYCDFYLFMWPRQESNLDLELRKLLYYPLYYKAKINAPL